VEIGRWSNFDFARREHVRFGWYRGSATRLPSGRLSHRTTEQPQWGPLVAFIREARGRYLDGVLALLRVIKVCPCRERPGGKSSKSLATSSSCLR
jgi:hypothetical protein